MKQVRPKERAMEQRKSYVVTVRQDSDKDLSSELVDVIRDGANEGINGATAVDVIETDVSAEPDLLTQVWVRSEIRHLLDAMRNRSEFLTMKLEELLRNDEVWYGDKFILTNDPAVIEEADKL
jgi:hypothetical protein